jgi:predicted nucleotidyltransferase
MVACADDILGELQRRRDALTGFGVVRLFLFGSFLHDEAKPTSDVDLLVDFDGDPTFDRYMDLKFFLEDLLGRRVDLATRDSLRPRLRTRIEREARRVA